MRHQFVVYFAFVGLFLHYPLINHGSGAPAGGN